jgi:uncharacterized membrane protein (UPF0136 family)
MKLVIRVLIALFGASFGSLQIQMSGCRPGLLEQPWSGWLCGNHVPRTLLILIPFLFVVLLFLLGKRSVIFRRPISVLLLVIYGIYGILDSFEWRAWWLALVPIGALLAAVGIVSGNAWGRVLIWALSLLFALYWIWSIGVAIHSGYLTSARPFQSALSLVPGIAFGLLAGFCCYVAIQQRNSETGWM